jgi:tRNA(Arg) A34 adenosine deaminase TadA
MENVKFMHYACDLANKSVAIGTGPFGCVIIDQENKIVGQAHNMVTLNNDPTAHAEIVAIRNACSKLNNFSLEGCVLYSSCEPCPMCLSAIYWSRIKTVYYGNSRIDAKNIGFDDEFIYDELKKDNKHKYLELKQIYCPNAAIGFDLWKNKIDKIKY